MSWLRDDGGMSWLRAVCDAFRDESPLAPQHLQQLLRHKGGCYGVLVSLNERIVLEQYIGNETCTRFRLFSSLSKPVIALAVLLLVQQGALTLDTTMEQLGIDVPGGDRCTILHLLDHRAGLHDFVSRLYFHREPSDLFRSLVSGGRDPANGCGRDGGAAGAAPAAEGTPRRCKQSAYLSTEAMLRLLRDAPAGRLLRVSKYNNAGYDLLGYIIAIVSKQRTDAFVRERVFEPLGMRGAGFQADEHADEAVPYDANGRVGIKEQQNWHCGNACVVCTLRDAHFFLQRFHGLLGPEQLRTYRSLCFFHREGAIETLLHTGSGDFAPEFAAGEEAYRALSRSVVIDMRSKRGSLKLVVAQTRAGANAVLDAPKGLGNRALKAAVERAVFAGREDFISSGMLHL